MYARRDVRPAAWCLLLTWLVACSSDNASVGPSAAVPPRRVTVLGDSLAVSPSRAEGFPAVLQARVTALGLPWTVTNAGVSGDTTSDGVARLESVLADSPRVLILALGANDGLHGVPIRTITANLSAIITRARQRHVAVLLCGMETPPLHGLQYSVDFHRVFPQLASDHGIPVVPFLLAGVVANRDFNQGDLVHPNADGARRIAENVWPYLEPLLRDRMTSLAWPRQAA